jgi:hypothetical protein
MGRFRPVTATTWIFNPAPAMLDRPAGFRQAASYVTKIHSNDMKKTLLYSLVLLVVGIISGIFLDEYVREIYEIKAPPRASTVPPSAIWEGGETGGNWFDCNRQQDSKYRCVVYSDTGDKVSDEVYGFMPEDVGGKLNPILRSSDTDIVLRGARLVRSH